MVSSTELEIIHSYYFIPGQILFLIINVCVCVCVHATVCVCVGGGGGGDFAAK